ncbi:hypothetical protein [Mesomycoplasma bovoculi]|uniref:Transmembrane protein n=1 Tax=Mesomycoplasma bovoculi M165/69 TaxID=743966 RepID=W5V1G9_9BACT|nr:hypothetical protein [Mesomycoplasma bovoculi]AHH45588.1 hypothetical protein MYB_02945 [Mesomycoplasma bovoculi M165/69]
MNQSVRTGLIVSVFIGLFIMVISILVTQIKKNKIVKEYQQKNSELKKVTPLKLNIDFINKIFDTNIIVEELELILGYANDLEFKNLVFAETDGLVAIASSKFLKDKNIFAINNYINEENFKNKKQILESNNFENLDLNSIDFNIDFIFANNLDFSDFESLYNKKPKIMIFKHIKKQQKTIINFLKNKEINYELDIYFSLIIIKMEKNIKI